MDLDIVPPILLAPDIATAAVSNVEMKTNTKSALNKSFPSKAAKQHAVTVGCKVHVCAGLGSIKLDTEASVVACL